MFVPWLPLVGFILFQRPHPLFAGVSAVYPGRLIAQGSGRDCVANPLSLAFHCHFTANRVAPHTPVRADRCANDPIALAGSALTRGARARVPVLGC